MKNYINKKSILCGLMLIWIFPFIQSNFHLFTENKLKGEFNKAPDADFNTQLWLDGQYSQAKEKYLNEQFGLRNFFVRLKNQVYFSLFGIVNAKDVVKGKDGVFFEEKYIKSYYGEDFVTDEIIKKRFDKLKFVQDTLKKLNKDLIVVFAPGKATFYPEFIPDSYKQISSQTNYKTSIQFAKESGINFIDFNSYFVKIKPSAKYPLYPKTGTHWSLYSMYMAQDSIYKYIESLRKIKLLDFNYQNVLVTDSLRDPDGDIELALNLLLDLSRFEMAYPKITFGDTACISKINLLTIADSYWMGIYFSHVPEKIFGNHEFWYYNNIVHQYFGPHEGKNPVLFNQKDELNKYDVICIMASEVNTKSLGWGFIEDAYKLYKYGEGSLADRNYQSEMNEIERNIYDSDKWFKEIKEKSLKNKIPLDSMMKLDAEWVYRDMHK
jgi:hypothetical protein